MAKTSEDWVKDGTPSETPVTSSTPDLSPSSTTPTPPAAETKPAAEAKPPAERKAATRDWANRKPDSAAPAAKTAEAAPAVGQSAAEQAAETLEEMLEGQLDGRPFQLKYPKGVRVPLKRGEEVEYVPLDAAIRGAMMEKDYRAKTSEFAEQRRSFEAQQKQFTRDLAVERARLKAQQDYLEEQAQFAQKAHEDPEEEARYLQHIQAYRTNPHYKKMVDDAVTGRMMTAERNVQNEEVFREELKAGAAQLWSDIQEMGKKYPTVDPDRVRVMYAEDLQAERVSVGRETVEEYFKREAGEHTRLLSPLQTQIAELNAKLEAALKAQTDAAAAAAHNDNTRQKIERTLSPVGAPAGGAPGGTPAKPQLTGKTLRARSQEWSRA